MDTVVVKEFKHAQEKLNSAVQQLDSFINLRYQENGDLILDLQEMMVDNAYEATLADLGL